MTPTPGPTTADAKGARRLRMLRDRRMVIVRSIREQTDRLTLICGEIRELEGKS